VRTLGGWTLLRNSTARRLARVASSRP
jgi:hypothetical protein